ncbi:MAG TPA: hypothetical protein VHA06_00050 [Candidatus Angelobacter sp.]|nr:hypothetical protein [Candidatus Angelobacter sp.]
MPSLIDDLVQETYLKLFAGNAAALRRFVCQHENALYGFLKVVASNVVQDHFRCSYSQKRGSGRDDENIDQAGVELADARPLGERRIGRACRALFNAGLPHSLERRILLREIDAYLKSREAKDSTAASGAAASGAPSSASSTTSSFTRDYTIFWLYYREGLTAKAIADDPSIGLTVKGVESTLLRLIKLIRLRLEQKPSGMRPASADIRVRRIQTNSINF